jgi:hypothetical protein
MRKGALEYARETSIMIEGLWFGLDFDLVTHIPVTLVPCFAGTRINSNIGRRGSTGSKRMTIIDTRVAIRQSLPLSGRDIIFFSRGTF